MEEELYNVIFLGPVHNDDVDYANKLTEGLMDHFNLPIESVTKMMRWAPITVKKGLTFKEAAKYRVVLESVGAQVKLEPMDIATEDKPILQPETDAEVSHWKPTFEKPYLFFMAIAIIAIVILIGLLMI